MYLQRTLGWMFYWEIFKRFLPKIEAAFFHQTILDASGGMDRKLLRNEQL